jgi:zinc protease
MKVFNKALFAIAVILFSITAHAIPRIQHWTTSNGAQVYFVATQGLPILDVKLTFDVGSARDSAKLGVSAFTSKMLKQGAAGLTAKQVAEALENVGASLGVSSSRDFTSLTFRSLTDMSVLDASWQVFTKVLTKPDFPEKDFQRIKDQIQQGIKRRAESPSTLAQLALYKHIFADHPYSKPIAGGLETVAGITVDDLKDTYRQNYVTNKLVITVVGDISRQQVEQRVEALVKDLPQGDKTVPLAAVAELQKGGVVHQEYPSSQTHLYYAAPVIAYNDPDYFALYVGNHILGGSGFTSRIVKEIREKRGLAYSAYSYFNPMAQKGPFLIGLQTRNEKAEEAATAVKQTLNEFIQNGPAEEEVVASKKNITGGFALRLDNNKKLLNNVANIATQGAPLDYLNTYIENINAVTAEQIKQVFQRRVHPERMVMVTVGQK